MPNVSRGQDHPHRGDALHCGFSYLIRVALRTGSLLVGHIALGGSQAQEFRPLPSEEADQMGMKPYSRADAEVLKVLTRMACKEPHEGTGAHVEYWIGRSWCTLVWLRSSASDNGRITLRLTEAGRRELAVWQNRRARA